ncbi:MAG: leucine-rich repeat protein [Oscillospiraceae bacterium]
MKKIRKGFTLVEVICVLTIIAIIAAIAVPNISGYIEKSKINNCRSTMTDFVNDLEYKIVSKRYYDISELNDELVEYVKNSSAVEPEIKYTETDNSRTTSVEAKICPNDGTYKLSWTISPNIDSESGVTDIYTANVNVSDCVCKCVTGENSVVHTGHEFTAALVASEYIDSGKTPEQKYEEIINIIIENVEKSEAGTGDLAGIVKEVEGKNHEYEIAGLTTTLDKKVEWISVYYHDTFSAEESKYKFLTRSEGKLIVKDLTEEEFNNKSNWPSAEGTCGSAVYKEGWNATCYVGGLNDRDANNQEIGWIQRDGNWYVQKSNNVKGIDFTVDENSNLSGYPLISDDGCKLNNDKNLLIQTKSSANVSDIKNALQVTAEYKNGNKVIFDHISATDLTKEDYFIKNGFIIVSSESDVSWAGIYENSSSAASEKATLKSMLDAEDELIGKFLSGEKSELIIAYQEYFKTYNSETKEYTRTPVTCFGKLSREYNAETGNAEIKNEEGEVIFTIEETQNDGYEINYNQSPESNNMFRVEDLSVKRTVTYVVKDTNGNTVYSFKGSGVDVKHVEENDNSGSLGFYVGDYGGYTKEKEISGVKNINIVGSQTKTTWIFLNNDINNPIATIATDNTNYYWTYKKNENDTEFDIGKINVTISYPVNVFSHRLGVTVKTNGAVTYTLNHRTNESSDFYYYVTDNSDNQDTWDPDKEADIIKNINSFSTKAYIKVFKNYDHNYNHKRIADIESYLDSVTADYTNDGGAFSFDKLTASAHYVIDLIDSVNNSNKVAQIKHSVPLNHDDTTDNKRRYYITVNYDHNSDINNAKTNEISAISELRKTVERTAYVVYCDNFTKWDDIYVNVTSNINPPDVVYIPDSDGLTDAHMIAYIGTNPNVTVPASHTGYWSLSEPSSDVNFIKKEVNMQSVGTQTYYFIDDGKTYTISQIGTVPVNPPNIDDSYKIKFPSGYTLQTLKISDKVKTIGEAAFMDSGLTSLIFDDNSSLNVISPNAFKKCEQLENLDLPDSVTEIGKEAFANLESVKTIKLGNSVTSIGISAFTNCKANETTEFIIPKTVTSIGENAFNCIEMQNAKMIIKGVSDSSDNSIGENIFNNAKFKSLELGENVRIVGANAFSSTTFNNNSSSLTLGDSVKEIQNAAFKGCGFTEKLNLNKVEKIGDEAFMNCSHFKYGLTIPETVESIGQEAFNGFASSVTDDNTGKLIVKGGSYVSSDVSSDKTVVGLGGLIFLNAKFNGVTIGGNVTKIDKDAFKNLPYKSLTPYKPYNDIKGPLTICDSVTEIGENAFNGCANIKELKLSTKLKSISNGAFYGCSGLSGNLVIPDSVESIGIEAFKNCTGFDGTLTLGNGLKTIDAEAFAYCKRFQGGLTIPVSVTDGIGKLAFREFAGETSSPGILELNSGSYDGGKSIGPFIFTGAKFSGLTIGGIVENIGSHAFHHGGQLTSDNSVTADYSKITGSIKLQDKVTTVENNAFYGCTGLNGTISLTEVTSIGAHAFENCSNLTGIANLNSVQTIGDSAFKNCSKMKGDLSFPSTLTSIGSSAFYNGSSIGLVSIPDSVTSIGSSAFENSGSGSSLVIYGCSGKETVDGKEVGVFGDGENSIFRNAHYSNITIGGSIKTIKEKAFKECKRFSGTLTISGNVEEIQKNAFDTCENLTGLSLEKGHIQKIYEGAFARCKRVEGGLYIPPTVNYMERCAFKQFAELTPDDKIGELKVYGTSDANGNLGDPDSNNDGAPLFSSAHFKGVKIGGNVKIINYSQFNNRLFYNFGKDLVDTNNNVITSPLGGSDNYDFSGISGDLIIEDGVEKIGSAAFFAMQFDNVTIPKSVKEIHPKAFLFTGTGKGSLTVLGASNGDNTHTLGDGINPIFLGSKFNGVTIGGSVEHIGAHLFHNKDTFDYYLCEEEINDEKVNVKYNYTYSNITGNLTIQDEVISIGESAFESCAFNGRLLLGVNANSVKLDTIDKYAFKNCNNFTGDLIVPYSINKVDLQAFFCFAKQSSNPGQLILWAGTDSNGSVLNGAPYDGAQFRNMIVTGTKIKKINDYAFSCEVFNDGKTKEGFAGFTGNLELNTGENENKIEVGTHAFYGCTGFDGELIIRSVNKIGESAFYNCVNFSGGLNIPYGMNGIGESAFYRFASETNNPGMFELWSGTRVENNLQYLSGQPFRGAKFKDMLVHGSVNVIDNDAFNSYNITDGDDFRNFTGSLIFTSETEIGSWAFCCDTGFDGELLFKTDSDGKGVSKIGEGAFSGCTNFYTNYKTSDGSQAVFTIPETVTEIKRDAFYSMCSGITDFNKIPKLKILGASLTAADSNGNIEKAFGSTGPWNSSTQKYDTINIFKNAKFNNVYIGGQVQSIAERAFDNSDGGYNGITGDIEINVKNIWEKAFYKMESVDENYRGKLILDEGVEQIGPYAFAETRFFGSVTEERSFVIPGSVKSIGSCAFQYFCSGFGNPPSLTVRGYASANVENKGNGYRKSDDKNYCDIFEYSCFNNVTFEGNVSVIGTGAFNNSGRQYDGWTGTLTFNTGVNYVYTDAFKSHKFNNVLINKSVKRGGQGFSITEWSSTDKGDVFGSSKNVSTFK